MRVKDNKNTIVTKKRLHSNIFGILQTTGSILLRII